LGAIPLAIAVAAGIGPFAPDARADVTPGGNLSLTTDYVWRGTTQTQGDPAVQAGFKVAGESGFYGSVWASNVEFAPATHASSEFDFALGWAGRLGDDWVLDANVLHYRYPSTTVDLDWTELNGTLTWKNNYWVSLGWSNEALGFGESGTYGLLGARFPVNICMVVVFPAPLGPSRPSTSPRRSSRSIPRTAGLPPKLRERPRAATVRSALVVSDADAIGCFKRAENLL
jgi:uncharacterized protein (TIGR02001 family)